MRTELVTLNLLLLRSCLRLPDKTVLRGSVKLSFKLRRLATAVEGLE